MTVGYPATALAPSSPAVHGEVSPDQRARSWLLPGFEVDVAAAFAAAGK